jgi:hypothetical protein
MPEPEAWLGGPVDGVLPHLMPVAHALVQAGRDIEGLSTLPPATLWARPAGVASVGFHLQHVAGVLDRLLTYARGESLNDAQRAALRAEGQSGEPPADAALLVSDAQRVIAKALDQVRATPSESLLEPRAVGKQLLPSTVLGLLYHASEHVTRHVAQATTTARITASKGAGVSP